MFVMLLRSTEDILNSLIPQEDHDYVAFTLPGAPSNYNNCLTSEVG
jgi:hypothetical protein